MFTQRQNILEEIEALKQRDLQLRRQQEIDSRLYLLLSTLIIIIIIIIIHRQCLWCCPHDRGHCESSPGLFDECRVLQTERRVAANPETKPTNLGCESADKWLLPST